MSISVFRFFTTLENGIPISTFVFVFCFPTILENGIPTTISVFRFSIALKTDLNFLFRFRMALKNEKSNFRFSFFKNEIPNGSETEVYTIIIIIIIPREARAEGPSVARLINLSGRAGPSGAKPREFERKIYLYIYMCICLYL